MRTMLQPKIGRQLKPVFQVLESAALKDEAAEAKENRRSEKARFERFGKVQLPFAFSFPLCDLLICELENPQVSHENELPANSSTERSEIVTSFHRNYSTLHDTVLRRTESEGRISQARIPSPRASLVSLADFVYSRVVARSIRTFWPNQKKNPKYVLAYVEETLECGHVVDIHPSEFEKLTARKRQCHECQGFFGGLDLKKPARASKQAQRSRATGKVNWPAVGFAFVASVLIAIFAYLHRPKDILYCEIGCTPSTHVRVVEQYSDTDFMLQMVVAGVPQQPEVRRFCEKVPLEAGFTLSRLHVLDKGDCWSTAPFRLSYVIIRYFGTVMPTLPDNCHQDPANPIHGRVSCSGRPNFKY